MNCEGLVSSFACRPSISATVVRYCTAQKQQCHDQSLPTWMQGLHDWAQGLTAAAAPVFQTNNKPDEFWPRLSWTFPKPSLFDKSNFGKAYILFSIKKHAVYSSMYVGLVELKGLEAKCRGPLCLL